ncbi:N-acetylmuramoyl-L-alanine amidase [Campylobacter sp. RM11259]|uniref:N-acetylmuramoyl-L-alanine amidase n=1 Tax=Campylobacter sputorum TaxID=206 RepID=UPI00189649DB|nr:N-acetylmuramoyl-L-alanine amidase [Campylobacter sp. RM11259]MBF6678058.1 N-acetylmuramoyl-L-alanine amidase [Campylobacter sp. RM11259]
MVKILKIVSILCFSFCLCFGAFADDIKAFDTKFDSSSESIKLKYYHSMKNIYIQSIIKSDKNLKIAALKRLITSSKALDMDYADYEKELASLGISDEKKQAVFENKKQNIAKKVEKKSQDDDKPDTILRLLEVAKIDNAIRLKFNRPPLSKEVKEFNLNNKTTNRFVMDFSGILIGKSRNIENYINDEVRVAQFDKQTLRVVFSDRNKVEYNISRENNYIFITSNKKITTDVSKDNKTKAQVVTQKKTNSSVKTEKKQTVSSKIKRSSKLIVLDAGHGGKDSGAVGNGFYEKNIVLQVTLKTGKILKNMGYEVAYTRTNDKFINLRDRTNLANNKAASLFISIHANAAPSSKKAKSMNGVETFFLSPARSERSMNAAALENKSDIEEMNHFSKMTFLNFLNREKIISSNKLAIDIQSNILSSLKTKYKVSDGGVREAPFWVLVGALMPAVLVEIGYITHPTEGKRLANDAYQDSLAKGIAKGIEDYFIKTSL